MITALHVGGPTIHFRYAGVSFLTDPTFDEPRDYDIGLVLHKLVGPAVLPADLGPVDVVLLSHDQHPDNLDESGRKVLENVPRVYSTADAARRVPGVLELPTWTTARVGDVEITAVPALHGPEGCEPLSGVVTGFVLKAPGWPTVYHSGDNASVDVVAEVVDRVGPVDVALLHVGAANPGRFGDVDVTLNANSAVRAAELLGAARIVPIHADGWAHFTETLDRLALVFGYAGLGDRLVVPEPGVRLSL